MQNPHLHTGSLLIVATSLACLTQPAHAQCPPSQIQPNSSSMDGRFGSTMDLDANTMLIGAPGTEFWQGAAYIFNLTNGQWQQQATLIGEDTNSFDYFGDSLDLDGNFAAIGAWGIDIPTTRSGAVFVYHRTQGIWNLDQRITPVNIQEADYFGYAVALSDTRLVAGAIRTDDPGIDSGSVYIFNRGQGAWLQEAQLRASDAAAGDNFGTQVAIDGDLIVVGSPQSDGAGLNAGAAYVFRFNGTDWQQEAKLTAPDAAAQDMFGSKVQITGNWILIGAPLHDHNNTTDSGGVYTYHFDGSRWRMTQELRPSRDMSDSFFGASVQLSGQSVLIGAPREDGDVQDRGAAYMFELEASAWTQSQRHPNPWSSDDLFAAASAFSPNSLFISAPRRNTQAQNAGTVYSMRPCTADLDNNCTVNTLDFILFLGYYSFNDPIADFNGDGELSILDFLAYLNAYNLGC